MSLRPFSLPSLRSFARCFTAASVEKPTHVRYTGRKLEGRVRCANADKTNPRAWVQSLDCPDLSDLENVQPLGYVDLHPDVFAIHPRLDIVHKNLRWQAHYRVVDWRCITTRADITYRSQRKPWPQKGTGKARHGNKRTNIWIGGGQSSGPRGPHSYYYLLPRDQRITGLLSMLTARHVQDDLRIVENLKLTPAMEQEARKLYIETPNDGSDLIAQESADFEAEFDRVSFKAASYLRDLVDGHGWGPSVLFVTDDNCSLPDVVKESEEDGAREYAVPDDVAIRLACHSYGRFVEFEQSPIASAMPIAPGSPAPAPRALHPARGLTVMPVEGLNVWSMVHHDTLVLSLSALEKLEKRLLDAQRTIVHDQLGRDMDAIKPAPDWSVGRDWGDDDVSPYDVEQERHFTGTIGDLRKLKRDLA